MWVIVGFRLTHPFSGLCAEWRVSPAQRVLNYSSGAGLRVINQSKAPWGPCEAHREHRCTGHETGCLLITLGLVSPFPALGRLPPWGLPVCWLWGSLPGIIEKNLEPEKPNLWAHLSMHIVWEEKPASLSKGHRFLQPRLHLCLSHPAIDTYYAWSLMGLTWQQRKTVEDKILIGNTTMHFFSLLR